VVLQRCTEIWVRPQGGGTLSQRKYVSCTLLRQDRRTTTQATQVQRAMTRNQQR
jgi:hypothetical protein